MREYKPKIVCFSCKFGWGYLTGEATISAEIKNWIPIICIGKIDATQIMSAFEAGADGLLILGCPEGNCHYQDGNYEARKRIYLLQKLLESRGIEKERLRVVLSTDPAAKKIPRLLEEMESDLARLRPLKKVKKTGRMLKEATTSGKGK